MQESLKEMLKNSGSRGCKSKFGASKISVYGEATVEELEKQVPLRTLKWLQKNLDQQAPQEVKKTKYINVEGFSCANCAGKFERNVKNSGSRGCKVNFGIQNFPHGEATIEELEKQVLLRILKWF